MPLVQCPGCGMRLAAAAAPFTCPRCLVRRRGRFDMEPASAIAGREWRRSPVLGAGLKR